MAGRGAAARENTVTLATFATGGRSFAVDASQVREVVRYQPVTPLPKAPRLIEGVIDLRGVIIPVVDLGRALGGEVGAGGSRARIVVIEIDGMTFGLAVDAAVEILSVDSSAMDDPPALATHAGYDATRAVVRRAGEDPVLVLSLEHLLESIYRSALSPEEARP